MDLASTLRLLGESVQVFQKEQPGGLLGVVEFGGAAGLFPRHIVDIFEGMFEHAVEFTFNMHELQEKLSWIAGIQWIYHFG